MDQFKTQENLTFQFISFYDRTIFHFVERVTDHLRYSLNLLIDETIKNSNESLIFGDLIPERYLSTESRYLVYLLDQYQDVEDIIYQLNKDIFGDNLTGIPDPEIDVVVKFVYELNNKN